MIIPPDIEYVVGYKAYESQCKGYDSKKKNSKEKDALCSQIKSCKSASNKDKQSMYGDVGSMIYDAISKGVVNFNTDYNSIKAGEFIVNTPIVFTSCLYNNKIDKFYQQADKEGVLFLSSLAKKNNVDIVVYTKLDSLYEDGFNKCLSEGKTKCAALATLNIYTHKTRSISTIHSDIIFDTAKNNANLESYKSLGEAFLSKLKEITFGQK